MEGKTLIIPRHPHEHRFRLAAILGFAVLGVIGVGVVQVMMTFSKMKLAETRDDFDGMAASLETLKEEAVEKETVEDLSGLVSELRTVLEEQKVLQEEGGDSITETEMPPTSNEGAVGPATGTVAGAQTEAEQPEVAE